MIRQNVNLSALMPIGRTKAAEIAGVAGKYTCMLTLERNGIVLNLKSMIGLLSQTVPADGEMVLVAQGADEQEACKAMVEVLG